MRRDSSLLQPGKVVHVVGPVTDEVFSFLGPAAQAVARSGRDQVVVMIDELRCRHHVANLHESAELVMAPRKANPFKQWAAMREACHKALSSGPLHAVHLHGMLPALVGAQAVRASGIQVPMFFSPHGSSVIGSLRSLGRLGRLAWLLLGNRRPAAIVNVPQETTAFETWASSELVESPVSQLFFDVPRREARHPLVVTGGREQNPRCAELYAQLAVLLSGEEELRISFNWIGAVDAVSKQRLNAAGVGVFDVQADADCAARLAAGWVYLRRPPRGGPPCS